MLLAHALHELLEAHHILRTPLLVTDAEVLEVEGLGVTHLSADLTILSGGVAIGKLDEVDGVLYVGIKLVYSHVCMLAMVLVLA